MQRGCQVPRLSGILVETLDLGLELGGKLTALLRIAFQQMLKVDVVDRLGRNLESVLSILAGLNELIQRGRHLVHAVSSSDSTGLSAHREASSSASSASSASMLMTLSASSVSFSSVTSSSSRF